MTSDRRERQANTPEVGEDQKVLLIPAEVQVSGNPNDESGLLIPTISKGGPVSALCQLRQPQSMPVSIVEAGVLA